MKRLEAFDLEEAREQMKEDKIDRLIDYTNRGVLSTDNFGGIVIVINTTGESVFMQKDYGQDDINTGDVLEKKLYHSSDGGTFFIFEDEEYYLHEFLRGFLWTDPEDIINGR